MSTFNVPVDPEPLPAYRRDPDVVSIISSAPSYTSEAPTYRSRRQSNSEPDAPPAYPGAPAAANSRTTVPSSSPQPRHARSPRQDDATPRTGLPSQQYAPGFRARPVSNFDHNAYNVGAWSSITTSHASRQLHAVAARRASSSTAALLNSLSAVPPPLSASSSSSPSSSSTNVSSTAQAEPLLPQEDPDLVGEMAATRARNARLYREKCLRGEVGFRNEGRTWDFMLSQMADWDERQRSWKGFREQVSRPKLLGLGRRIGLRG